MKDLSVVKRYATALYETAVASDSISDLEADIRVLNKLFDEAPAIRDYCTVVYEPGTTGKIGDFIETAFLPYVSTLTGASIEIMAKNSRLGILPYLPEALSELINEKNGITDVRVESAAELEVDDRNDIIARLERRIGSRVRISWNVRPELIGGMTFHWNNTFLDMSLRGKFDTLKRQMKGIHYEK